MARTEYFLYTLMAMVLISGMAYILGAPGWLGLVAGVGGLVGLLAGIRSHSTARERTRLGLIGFIIVALLIVELSQRVPVWIRLVIPFIVIALVCRMAGLVGRSLKSSGGSS